MNRISLEKWTGELVSLWRAVLPIKVLYYSQEGDLLQIEFMEIFFLAWKWKLRLSKLIEKSSKEIIYLRNQSCKCHRYGRYTCVKNMKFWVKMWENTQFCWTKKFWVNSNNKFEVLSSNQPHMIYDVALQAFDHQRLPFQTILFNLSTKFVAIYAFFS